MFIIILNMDTFHVAFMKNLLKALAISVISFNYKEIHLI